MPVERPPGELESKKFKLHDLGPRVDRAGSFALPDERDAQGEPLPGEVTWVRLVDGDRSVEGKLYVPAEDAKDEVVIISPGLPGDGVGRFEGEYVPALLQSGLTVFSSRHNGLKLEGSAQEKYLKCPARKERAADGGARRLGPPFSYEELSREVITAFKALGPEFQQVDFLGHSTGAFCVTSSLARILHERPDLINKVGNFVALAGLFESYDREINKLDLSWLAKSSSYEGDLTLAGADKDLQAIEQLIATADWSRLKRSFMTAITSTGLMKGRPDEYIKPEVAQKFADFMKQRGFPRVNVVEYANLRLDPGKDAHDFANFPPGFVTRALTGQRQKALGWT